MSEVVGVKKERNKLQKKDNTRLSKKDKIVLSFGLLFLVVTIVLGIFLIGCEKPETESKKKADFSGITKICELATLRCFYHNTTELRQDATGLFNYGYKKLWMEYTGVIEVGIDADQVKVEKPDENNVVKVSVPEAKILNVTADTASMSQPITDTGIFTKITTEDQDEAFSQAQEDMEKEAKEDQSILARGQDNAKKLIEEYIVNVGRQIGETYTVEWME